MTSNHKPASLDELLDHAAQYAEFNLSHAGSLPATLFLVGPKGPAVCVPPSLADEAAKNSFAADARLLCIAHGATAAVMELEAWALLSEPGVPLDPQQRPSQAPNRREVVALVGEAAGIHQVKFLPILRNVLGQFTGFGEAREIRCDQIQGRFAQILPAQLPTPEEQARAQAMLRARGIAMAAPPAQKPKTAPRPRHRFSC